MSDERGVGLVDHPSLVTHHSSLLFAFSVGRGRQARLLSPAVPVLIRASAQPTDAIIIGIHEEDFASRADRDAIRPREIDLGCADRFEVDVSRVDVKLGAYSGAGIA